MTDKFKVWNKRGTERLSLDIADLEIWKAAKKMVITWK